MLKVIKIGGHKMYDLKGKKFGRWKIFEKGEQGGTWRCKCKCGTIRTVPTYSLRSGASKSCGCIRKEQLSKRRKSHGYTIGGQHPVYKVWLMMKQRCLNPNNKDYKYYGNKGITICERWINSFENFLEDMGDKPKKLTLDRIDNKGNYEPSNCKWSTRSEQMRNTIRTRKIKYDNKTLCIKDWSIKLKINISTLRSRLKKYPPKIAFNT